MVYDPGDCFAITEGKEVPEVYISQPSLLIFRDCQGKMSNLSTISVNLVPYSGTEEWSKDRRKVQIG